MKERAGENVREVSMIDRYSERRKSDRDAVNNSEQDVYQDIAQGYER